MHALPALSASPPFEYLVPSSPRHLVWFCDCYSFSFFPAIVPRNKDTQHHLNLAASFSAKAVLSAFQYTRFTIRLSVPKPCNRATQADPPGTHPGLLVPISLQDTNKVRTYHLRPHPCYALRTPRSLTSHLDFHCLPAAAYPFTSQRTLVSFPSFFPLFSIPLSSWLTLPWDRINNTHIFPTTSVLHVYMTQR